MKLLRKVFTIAVPSVLDSMFYRSTICLLFTIGTLVIAIPHGANELILLAYLFTFCMVVSEFSYLLRVFYLLGSLAMMCLLTRLCLIEYAGMQKYLAVAFISIAILFPIMYGYFHRWFFASDVMYYNMHAVTIFSFLLLATTVPEHTLLYKNGNMEHVTDTRFLVSPFNHVKPFEKLPNKVGVLRVSTEADNVKISAQYVIEHELLPEEWLTLKTLQSGGVSVPHSTSSQHDIKNIMQAFFTEKYPFIKVGVRIDHISKEQLVAALQ